MKVSDTLCGCLKYLPEWWGGDVALLLVTTVAAEKKGLKKGEGGEYVAKERTDISNRFQEEERGTLKARQ